MAALIAHVVRGAPRLGEPGGQAVGQPVGRDSHLFEAVAVAQRHGAVLQRLAVDSDSPGGADLVLAPVAAPDRAALVVLGWNRAADLLVDLAGLLGHPRF